MKKTMSIFFVGFTCFLTVYFFLNHQSKINIPAQDALPSSITLKQVEFTRLPGWKANSALKSLAAFQISCKAFLRQMPEQAVGNQVINLKAKDWYPACTAAVSLHTNSDQEAREFFEKWFAPVEFIHKKPLKGLFTGYYMPLSAGSLTKTDEYNTPIYGLPSNLVHVNLADFSPDFKARKLTGFIKNNKLIPLPTREQINHGALEKKAPVLVWMKSPIDRLFLEIQGSGIVQLPDGKQLYLGYAGQNGAPYTPVGKVLVEKGVMTVKNASMQKIRSYLEKHPQEMDDVLNKNKSFVFFQYLKNNAALGTQGVALTPGYSLAVDKTWIPLGTPLWLNTSHPHTLHSKKTLRRLMIAQDTGGAIRGTIRGDVYWGAGKKATFIAGHMKNRGNYWLLLPRHTVPRILQANAHAQPVM